MVTVNCLDTNVLLSNPGVIHAFDGEDVAIYVEVLEELDKKKCLMNSVGANARAVNRILAGMENLFKGEKLENEAH